MTFCNILFVEKLVKQPGKVLVELMRKRGHQRSNTLGNSMLDILRWCIESGYKSVNDFLKTVVGGFQVSGKSSVQNNDTLLDSVLCFRTLVLSRKTTFKNRNQFLHTGLSMSSDNVDSSILELLANQGLFVS